MFDTKLHGSTRMGISRHLILYGERCQLIIQSEIYIIHDKYHHTPPLPVQAWRTSINCRNAAKPPGSPPQICGGNPGGFAAYYRSGCRAGAAAGSAEGVEEMMLVMVGVGAWRGAGVLVAW